MLTKEGEFTRYNLSFTSGALLNREATIAAALYLESYDWTNVRKHLAERNLFQASTTASARRRAGEVVRRLSSFSDREIALLAESSPTERKLLLWVAACRHYTFIGEFAEEVVRERWLLLIPTLSYAEFDRFVSSKLLWHPELAELKKTTLNKLRGTLFRMLTEAELLANGNIQQAFLTEATRNALNTDGHSDIRFLPTNAPVGV